MVYESRVRYTIIYENGACMQILQSTIFMLGINFLGTLYTNKKEIIVQRLVIRKRQNKIKEKLTLNQKVEKA